LAEISGDLRRTSPQPDLSFRPDWSRSSWGAIAVLSRCFQLVWSARSSRRMARLPRCMVRAACGPEHPLHAGGAAHGPLATAPSHRLGSFLCVLCCSFCPLPPSPQGRVLLSTGHGARALRLFLRCGSFRCGLSGPGRAPCGCPVAGVSDFRWALGAVGAGGRVFGCWWLLRGGSVAPGSLRRGRQAFPAPGRRPLCWRFAA
jgi:hypothetical protein